MRAHGFEPATRLTESLCALYAKILAALRRRCLAFLHIADPSHTSRTVLLTGLANSPRGEIARSWSEPGNSGSSLFGKARQLLTRHWSASSWRARADILRTAEWLVGVGKIGKRSAESASCEQWHSTRGHLPTNEKPSASTHMAMAITDVHFAKVR